MAYANEIAAYESDGFAVIRAAFSTSEVKRLSEEIDHVCRLELVEPSNLRTPHMACLDDQHRLEKIDPIIDLSSSISMLAQDERLLSFARELFQTSDVSLFRDKLIIRPTGSLGYAVHQDYSWWHPYDPDQYVTLAVCLSDCTCDNGAVQFFPGSHVSSMLPEGERRALSEQELSELDAESGVVCEASAGDVIAFHSLCVHWSGPNLTAASRPVLYFSYMPGLVSDAYDSHLERQTRRLLAEKHVDGIRHHT